MVDVNKATGYLLPSGGQVELEEIDSKPLVAKALNQIEELLDSYVFR